LHGNSQGFADGNRVDRLVVTRLPFQGLFDPISEAACRVGFDHQFGNADLNGLGDPITLGFRRDHQKRHAKQFRAAADR